MSNLCPRLLRIPADIFSVCISPGNDRLCQCDPVPGWCPSENRGEKSWKLLHALSTPFHDSVQYLEDKGLTRPVVNHGDHHMQMLPLADNPPCFIVVITHVTAGVCKYFFNSTQPSYIVQNAPKYRKHCGENMWSMEKPIIPGNI